MMPPRNNVVPVRFAAPVTVQRALRIARHAARPAAWAQGIVNRNGGGTSSLSTRLFRRFDVRQRAGVRGFGLTTPQVFRSLAAPPPPMTLLRRVVEPPVWDDTLDESVAHSPSPISAARPPSRSVNRIVARTPAAGITSRPPTPRRSAPASMPLLQRSAVLARPSFTTTDMPHQPSQFVALLRAAPAVQRDRAVPQTGGDAGVGVLQRMGLAHPTTNGTAAPATVQRTTSGARFAPLALVQPTPPANGAASEADTAVEGAIQRALSPAAPRAARTGQSRPMPRTATRTPNATSAGQPPVVQRTANTPRVTDSGQAPAVERTAARTPDAAASATRPPAVQRTAANTPRTTGSAQPPAVQRTRIHLVRRFGASRCSAPPRVRPMLDAPTRTHAPMPRQARDLRFNAPRQARPKRRCSESRLMPSSVAQSMRLVVWLGRRNRALPTLPRRRRPRCSPLPCNGAQPRSLNPSPIFRAPRRPEVSRQALQLRLRGSQRPRDICRWQHPLFVGSPTVRWHRLCILLPILLVRWERKS